MPRSKRAVKENRPERVPAEPQILGPGFNPMPSNHEDFQKKFDTWQSKQFTKKYKWPDKKYKDEIIFEKNFAKKWDENLEKIWKKKLTDAEI